MIRINQKTYTHISHKFLGVGIILLLLLQNLAVYFEVIAAEGDTTEYGPQAVRSVSRSDSNEALDWNNITEALTYNVSFEAGLDAFTIENSASLVLTGHISFPQELEEPEDVPPVEADEVPDNSGGGTTPVEENVDDVDPVDDTEEEGAPDDGEQQENTDEVLDDVLDNNEDSESDTEEGEVEEDTDEAGEEDVSDEPVEDDIQNDDENSSQDNEETEPVEESADEDTDEDVDFELEQNENDSSEVEEQEQEDVRPAEQAPVPATENDADDISVVAVSALEGFSMLDIFNASETRKVFGAIGSESVLLATDAEMESSVDELEIQEEVTLIQSPYLEFSRFRGHPENKDERFKDASLKVSLGAPMQVGARIVFEYSLDGKVWKQAGMISLDQGQSNALQEDFYYMTLRGVDTIGKVQTVRVRASYMAPIDVLNETDGVLTFIDGLSIETTSTGQILNADELIELEEILIDEDLLTPEERKLHRLTYANKIFELLFQGNLSESLEIYHQKYMEGVPPLELSLKGASTTAQAELSGNFVIYRDVYPATDFYYIPTEHGLKEEILLRDNTHPETFTYVLNLEQFDYVQTKINEIDVYKKGHAEEPLFKLYTISAPYMEDASGERSENIVFEVEGDELVLKPDQNFLATALYPVIVDPTIELSVLTTYSHPLTGEMWNVDFVTVGESDLYITPRNQETRDEIEFMSLVCDGTERVPEILDNEVLYYPNWSCDDKVATVSHLINLEGGHILDFSFGGAEDEVVMDVAFNGTVTWDGGGGDNNWSTCANWSADTCPTSADDVVFDGTSTKDAYIDVDVTALKLDINVGYTGTITQGDGNDMSLQRHFQYDGTFRGGAATTTFTGSMTIDSGATYIAPSTTQFTGFGKTFDYDSSQTFEKFILNLNSAADVANLSGDTLVTTDVLEIKGGKFQNGSLSAQGDILISGTGSGIHTATLNFDSANPQTFRWTANGIAPAITLDSADDALDTFDVNGVSNPIIRGITTTADYTGTFRLENEADTTVFNIETIFNLAAGTAAAGGPGIWDFESMDFDINTGATFLAPTTTRFTGGNWQTLVLDSSQTFENLDISLNSTGAGINMGGYTFTITDELILTQGFLQNGTLNAQGDITVTANASAATTATLNWDSATVQTLTFTGNGTAPLLRFDSADDALDIVDINGQTSPNVAGIITTVDFSGEFDFTNEINSTVIGIVGGAEVDFTLDGGTVRGGPGTWNFSRVDIDINSGATFVAPSTTQFSSGLWPTANVDTTQTFDNVVLSLNSSGAPLPINSGDTWIVTGTTTITQGAFTGTGGIFEVRGDLVWNSDSTYTNAQVAPLLFTGSSTSGKANQTIEFGAADIARYDGDITINKSEGEVRLLSELDMNGSSQDLILTNGTFYANGNNITVDGTSGTFTVADGTTLKLQGDEIVTTNSGYPTFASGSTALYVGDGDGGADTFDIQSLNYANLLINMIDSGDVVNGDIVTDSGLEGYWDMDEASGTSLADSSGNGRTATAAAGAGVISGQYNNGRDFNASSEYATFSAISVPTAHTISFWANFPVPASAGGYRTWVGRAAAFYHHVLIDSNGILGIWNNAGHWTAYDTDNLSGWHHVAAVASGGSTEFFIDGSSVGSVASQITEDISIFGNTTTTGNQNAGEMDELRIYSIALTSDQIAGLYAYNALDFGDVNVADFTLSSGTFTAPSTTMTVSGDFTRTGGTFTPNGGTVSLDGTSQTISGDTTFYNLSKTVTSADTLTYGAGDRQTVTNAWTMTGTSGNVLTLQSSSGGSQWEIDPQNLYTLEYLSVSDSNNVNATELSINESIVTNGGNNTNWSFNNLPTASTLGPTAYINGSWGNDSTPTFTFTTSDSDAENVKYHIVIDDTSNFSSPVVNYTSALATQGAQSFTVGQAEGSGTYTVGSAGQTLVSGSSYYWRVSATDATGGSGATTTANSGSIALRVDTTAPTSGNTATSSVGATAITVTISGASDGDSGLATNPYNFHDQTEDSYSGATNATSYQFTGLVPDTEYVFDVGVVDIAGNTATSSTVTERTLALAPTGPSVTVNSNTAITFSWNGGANPPTVSYYPVNITSSTTPGWISAKTYQFTGLTCETLYEFEVKARNSDNVATATTTKVSATTSSCTPEEEEEGGSESGGGGGGGSTSQSGNTTPTITYTPAPVAPVDTTVETHTISVDSSRSTAGGTLTSSNRTLYLTFEPPTGTQEILISNNPEFEGAQLFEYSPDFAVQWNICQDADGTLLPESQCARNLEYNVYIKFVNNYGLETQTIQQRVFLYDPILPDEFYDLPQQDVAVDIYNTEKIITYVEFPFDSPFGDVTGRRQTNFFGQVVNNSAPSSRTSTNESPAPFVNAGERYRQALEASYNVTYNVVGTITQYITKVTGIPGAIRDNIVTNIYFDGIVNSFGKISNTVAKTTLTTFEWLFGSEPQGLASNKYQTEETSDTNTTDSDESESGIAEGGNSGSSGTGDEPGSGDVGDDSREGVMVVEDTDNTFGGGIAPRGPVADANYSLDTRVRDATRGVVSYVATDKDDVQLLATLATVAAPGFIALQQAFSFALFAGASFAWLDLLFVLLRHIHNIMSILHVRKKRRTWGFVYDARTKMPLEPVLVELVHVETGHVADRSVTDASGQFGFLPQTGRFYIRARKSHYIFPSQLVMGTSDGAYEHIYHGEEFELEEGHNIVAPNIPLDPIASEETQDIKGIYLKYNLLKHHWGERVSGFMFWAGFVLILANLMITVTALNIILFGFYIALVAYRYARMNERLWGRVLGIPETLHGEQIVIEVTHKRMPQALLGRAVVHHNGKFFLKVISPGTYILQVKVTGGAHEKILLTEDVAVGKDLVVNHDVYLN